MSSALARISQNFRLQVLFCLGLVVLQFIIVCCSESFQCMAMFCRVCALPRCMYCSVLQCVAVCCSVFQCVAVCCSVLQCVAVRCIVLQFVAVFCSELQFVAECCIVLQCIAVFYSVLQ